MSILDTVIDAIWLQEDAEYCYRQARAYRDKGDPVSLWIATKIQATAAESSKQAREAVFGKEF